MISSTRSFFLSKAETFLFFPLCIVVIVSPWLSSPSSISLILSHHKNIPSPLEIDNFQTSSMSADLEESIVTLELLSRSQQEILGQMISRLLQTACISPPSTFSGVDSIFHNPPQNKCLIFLFSNRIENMHIEVEFLLQMYRRNCWLSKSSGSRHFNTRGRTPACLN